MKYILIPALLLVALSALFAQSTCNDEYVCTPMGGCRWVTVCKPNPYTPAPPAPPSPGPRTTQCHDEYICTGMNGCRWVTICR